jgi:SH3-like domain-containing protein
VVKPTFTTAWFRCRLTSSTKARRAVRQFRCRTAVFALAAQIIGIAVAANATAFAQDALTPGSFKAFAAEGVETRVSDFSGQPVPRYASLKYDEVNGRAGPSTDYPVRWNYEREGLPVIVVRESKDWRMIRDPLGDEVWINKSQLAGQRTAITTDTGVVYRDPRRDAARVAKFSAGAVVALGDCGNAWCRVTADGHKGWVQRSHLWGADPLPAAPGKN